MNLQQPEHFPCLVPNKYDCMTDYTLICHSTYLVVVSLKNNTIKAEIQLSSCHVRVMQVEFQEDEDEDEDENDNSPASGQITSSTQG